MKDTEKGTCEEASKWVLPSSLILCAGLEHEASVACADKVWHDVL